MPKQISPKWADIGDGERADLCALYLGGRSAESLSEEYCPGTKPVTLRRRLQELIGARKLPAGNITVGRGDFQKHWGLYCELIGRDPKKPLPKAQSKKKNNRRRIVVLCDMHGAPDKEIVARAADEKPDIVIEAGDIFDAFAMSKFIKMKMMPIADEIANIRATDEFLVSKGIRVKKIRGNHDDRALRYFAQRIEPEFMPLVQWDLLELSCAGLEGAEIVRNTYDFQSAAGRKIQGALQNTYIVHEGDALIAHAEVSRKGEARTADALYEWIERWRKPLGWLEPRLIVQAHIHRASVTYPQGGHEVRVEGGYCGEISNLQYTHDLGSAVYTPPVLGYTIFNQDFRSARWVTDLGTVKFVLC